MDIGHNQDRVVNGRRRVAVFGVLLLVACVACVAWSGSNRSSVLVGAYDASSKQQELAIIQRALSDEERGTTPPRVLAEEHEEAAQHRLEKHHDEMLVAADAQKGTHWAKAAPMAAKAAPALADVPSKLTRKSAVKPAARPVVISAAGTKVVGTKVSGMKKAVRQERKNIDLSVRKKVRWQTKEKKIKKEFTKEILLEQLSTLSRVTELKDKIMKQVVDVLKEGKDKVAKLKSKEQAAETVVKYDKKQADLKVQLRRVQARATAKANALKRKLAAIDALENKYASNPQSSSINAAVKRLQATTPKQPSSANIKEEVSKVVEDYKAEDAMKQKTMRKKVKDEAYAKSNRDEDSMEKQLEETLDSQVLSMNKHTTPKLVVKSAKSDKAGPTIEAKVVDDSKKQANSASPKTMIAASNELHAAVKDTKPNRATPTTRDMTAKSTTQSKSSPTQTTVPTIQSAVKVVKKVKKPSAATQMSNERGGTSNWHTDDSPAAQIMKEISAVAHADETDTAAPSSSSSSSSQHAESDTMHTPALAKAASREQTYARANTGTGAAARASAAPTVVPTTSTHENDVQWAIKHGMPRKLANDPSQALQVHNQFHM